MKTKKGWSWRLVALSLAGVLPFTAFAGKPTSSSIPLRVSIFETVVDEQDTNAYFGRPDICPAGLFVGPARLVADTENGPTSAWNFTGWDVTADVSGLYDNGQDCKPGTTSCLRAEFSTNDKVFSLDTRSTAQPRKVTVDFTAAWDPVTNQPITNVPTLGATVDTPGLLQVAGLEPFTTMKVCSSDACPEARQIATKFWFTDPSASDVTWRVDWSAIRVLRMSDKVFYFIADPCGGSQLAGLSKLVGNRTKPRETLNGYYLIPMFFAAEIK